MWSGYIYIYTVSTTLYLTFGSFELVSSLVWWKAETNYYLLRGFVVCITIPCLSYCISLAIKSSFFYLRTCWLFLSVQVPPCLIVSLSAKTVCNILVYKPSGFSSKVFVRHKLVQPYGGTGTAWKNPRFILSKKSDSHAVDNLWSHVQNLN